MPIKRLVSATALGMALMATGCSDDDPNEPASPDSAVPRDSAVSDAGQGDAGPIKPGDSGTDLDATVGVGIDGSLPDGSTGPRDGSVSGDGAVLVDLSSTSSDAALDGATRDAGSSDAGRSDAGRSDAGTCSVNSPSFGCGTAISATWVRFESGLEIDTQNAIGWSPQETTPSDTALETNCENLVLGGLSDFHIPEMEEVRTLALGCPETQSGGACQVNTGDELSSASGDCSCAASLEGPFAGGRFCRPELPACDTLWTNTFCGPNDECDQHEHWFYDVTSGSIVRQPYGSAIAQSARGRCSTSIPANLLP